MPAGGTSTPSTMHVQVPGVGVSTVTRSGLEGDDPRPATLPSGARTVTPRVAFPSHWTMQVAAAAWDTANRYSLDFSPFLTDAISLRPAESSSYATPRLPRASQNEMLDR